MLNTWSGFKGFRCESLHDRSLEITLTAILILHLWIWKPCFSDLLFVLKMQLKVRIMKTYSEENQKSLEMWILRLNIGNYLCLKYIPFYLLTLEFTICVFKWRVQKCAVGPNKYKIHCNFVSMGLLQVFINQIIDK